MPRKARALPKSAMLHIIARGNNKIRLFRRYCDFKLFKCILNKYCKKNSIQIHHYVLMGTHYHILVWVENTSILATMMKAMHISYQYRYRKKYGYVGHLWHSRFKSIVITSEEHWIQCGRYIELNPVHAGICNDPNDYRWSSYKFYADDKKDNLMNPIYHDVVALRDGYRDFIIEGIDYDYQSLKKEFEFGKASNVGEIG